MSRAIAVLCLLLVLAPGGRVARAQRPRRPRIAVLEFRAGTEGASRLASRLAARLAAIASANVVGPEAARSQIGPGLEGEVARCRGETACVAGLGERLGVQEVVLVGISEFGDLILTLQRIDVAKKAVRGRVAESLEKGKEPEDAALEGFLRRLLPAERFRGFGTVAIRANVDGAKVVLGGKDRGQTPIAPVTVDAPAKLDLRLSKDGYVDFTASLDVPPNATVTVRPVLQRRGGSGPRWWVWAIAGGVAVAAGAGAFVLLEEDPSSVPGTLEW